MALITSGSGAGGGDAGLSAAERQHLAEMAEVNAAQTEQREQVDAANAEKAALARALPSVPAAPAPAAGAGSTAVRQPYCGHVVIDARSKFYRLAVFGAGPHNMDYPPTKWP